MLGNKWEEPPVASGGSSTQREYMWGPSGTSRWAMRLCLLSITERTLLTWAKDSRFFISFYTYLPLVKSFGVR